MLLNTVDYVFGGPLEDMSQAQTLKTLTTNLRGPLTVSIAFGELYSELAQYTKQQPSIVTPPGRIVSISNRAAHTPLQGYGAYCASKAALNSLTCCMALEWGHRGIIANTISPTVALKPLDERANGCRKSSDDILAQVSDSQASATLATVNDIIALYRNERETIGTEIEPIYRELRCSRCGRVI